MNRKETQGVLALIKAAYPSFYRDMTREDLVAVVSLWQKQFEDMDSRLVLAAVHALIAERAEGYPPTIGAVRAQARKLTAPQQMTELEAWALVSRATRNSAYGAEKEFAKLPPAVQRAVGRPEQLCAWALMDAGEVESVVASNFMRTYRAVAEREREEGLLPAFIREALPGFRMERVLPADGAGKEESRKTEEEEKAKGEKKTEEKAQGNTADKL